jgi:hypothetical protein
VGSSPTPGTTGHTFIFRSFAENPSHKTITNRHDECGFLVSELEEWLRACSGDCNE